MTRGDAELARRWATGELRRLPDTALAAAGRGRRHGPGPARGSPSWPEGSLRLPGATSSDRLPPTLRRGSTGEDDHE